jgi:hypothetical protein
MAHYSLVGHQLHRSSSAGADPTTGFVAVELTEDQLKLHKPYDLPPE